jgi:hypothetical protein
MTSDEVLGYVKDAAARAQSKQPMSVYFWTDGGFMVQSWGGVAPMSKSDVVSLLTQVSTCDDGTAHGDGSLKLWLVKPAGNDVGALVSIDDDVQRLVNVWGVGPSSLPGHPGWHGFGSGIA